MNIIKNVKIQYFDELVSTNNYAKEKRSEGENLIVVAQRQTGGRGTKGRSFSSNEGGVYLTKLTFYENFPATRAFEIMMHAATSVCKTLQAFGLTPKIKWPNDVYVADKKICGILIENAFQGAFVQNSVVGIGVNVQNVLPEELKEIATTMYQQLGEKIPVGKVTETLIGELLKEHTAEEYLSFVGYMDRPARMCQGERWFDVILRSVDREGHIWVELDGKIRPFSAVEISVRI